MRRPALAAFLLLAAACDRTPTAPADDPVVRVHEAPRDGDAARARQAASARAALTPVVDPVRRAYDSLMADDVAAARVHLDAADAATRATLRWRYQDASCALYAGDYAGAIERYDALRREAPGYEAASNRQNAGWCLTRLKRYEEADTALREALSLQPGGRAAAIHHSVVLNLLDWERLDQAAQRADEGLREFPSDAGLWDVRGWALFRLGRSQEANSAYAKAAALVDARSHPGEPIEVLCPLAGDVRIMQAPGGAFSHRSLVTRFAWDLALVDPDGQSRTRNEDFASFGAPVRAVADGVVRTVTDGIPDHAPYARDPKGGNSVVLSHGAFLSEVVHLKNGSVRVKSGDPVRAGQVIAQCGNSGHSGEPHVHFTLMLRSSEHNAMLSVPARFRGRAHPFVPLVEGGTETFE